MSQSLRQPGSFDPPATSLAPQVWFSEASETEPALPRVVFASADPEPVIDCGEFDRRGMSASRCRAVGGLAGSLLLHAGILLSLGLFVTVARQRVEEIVWTDPIRAALSEDEVVDLDPLGAKLEIQLPAANSTFDRPAPPAESFTPDELDRRFSAAQFEPAFAAEDQAEHKIVITPAEGKKFRYRKPGNGQAVTAGSFTVWTEPADPIPRQPYLIVFQIRVPPHLEKFPKSDLKIDVRGTDRFHLMIPDPRRDYALVGDLDVIDGQVQLVIPIPGAPALVRDLIQVESRKILRERQRLTITF